MKFLTARRINLFLTLYVFFASAFVLLYRATGIELFVLHVKNIQISFNTAFLLLLSALVVFVLHKKKRFYKPIVGIFTVFIFLFSSITLYYYLNNNQGILNSIIVENIEDRTQSSNMSIITSISFIIFTIAVFAITFCNKKIVKAVQYLYFFLPVIATINIVSSLLQTVLPSKIGQVETMSIQASASFLILTYLLLLNFPNIGFKNNLMSNNYGSKFLRASIPFVTLIPFAIGYIVLTVLDKELISSGFGIILYTVGLMLTGFITLYFTSNNINGAVALRRDAEKKLRSNNKELSLFKAALDEIAIVALVDKDFRFKKVNDNFCNFTGLKRKDIYGKTNAIIRSEEHDDSFFNEIWKTLTSGKVWIGEIKNKVNQNETAWTNTAIVPIREKGSKEVEYISIKFDITEKKQFEEMLESSYVKKLRNKNYELEQFTYITSHDLQEPLRTIGSFNEILRTEYFTDKNEEVSQIFKFIDEATLRMSNLIKNLLDYSLIGKSDELDLVDFNDLLEDIVLDLKPKIKKHNAKVIVGNLPKINVFPVSIKILLENLISNGIKFSRQDEDPIIKINATLKQNVWEFSVQDNGIGIRKEHQEKIFSIFKRLHLKEDYDGTGIGLAHCQKIVALHDGDIWVKSELNKGSIFYFTIPILDT